MKSISKDTLKNNPLFRLTGIIFLFLATSILLTFVTFWGQEEKVHFENFSPGFPARQTYYSPVEFTFIDEAQTEEARFRVKNNVPPVYLLDGQLWTAMNKSIGDIFNEILFLQGADEETFQNKVSELPDSLPFYQLQDLMKVENLAEVKNQVISYLEDFYQEGVLEYSTRRTLERRGFYEIYISSANTAPKRVMLKDVHTFEDLQWEFARRLQAMGLPYRVQQWVLGLMRQQLSPNLFFDEALTEILKEGEAKKIPPIEVTIRENQLIVQRGMVVSSYVKSQLDAIAQEVSRQRRLHEFLVFLFLTSLILFLSYFYMREFEYSVVASFRKTLLYLSAMGLTVFLCKLVVAWDGVSNIVMPFLLGPILISMFLSVPLALWGSLIISFCIGYMTHFSPEIFWSILITSSAAAFLSTFLKKRTDFLKIGFIYGVIYFMSLQGVLFLEGTLSNITYQAMYSFLGVLVVTMPLCAMLIYVFEYLFHMLTDISLLELSDLNHPLLKKMIIEAPGTYHHSLVVSRLSESACEEIGANALLARVGCYFHDIGKMVRSEYFTENQDKPYVSKHIDLSPGESYQIIVDHVNKGIELGRKYNLKKPILDFIPEHQGTGVVYYFYRKAADAAKPGEEVKPDDYRYPGPKPQTKETAVSMLADSTEAASRSLKDPSPDKLRQLVRKIINDKFIDGQLDECNLTLKDLHIIQEAFVKNLTAIFHSRISYPEKKEAKDQPDLFKKNEFSKFRTEE